MSDDENNNNKGPGGRRKTKNQMTATLIKLPNRYKDILQELGLTGGMAIGIIRLMDANEDWIKSELSRLRGVK